MPRKNASRFSGVLGVLNIHVIHAKDGSINTAGDSLNVRLIGSWPSSNINAIALDVNRKIAFIGGQGCVSILDVSDVSKPELLSEVILGSHSIEDLFFLNGYIYAVEFSGMFFIVSVVDPYNPQVVGNWMPRRGVALSVAIRDTILCLGYDLTASSGGTEIYSISDPSNPVFLSDYDGHGTPWQIVIRDSLVYAATENTGLAIFSITDPSNPNEVGQLGYNAYGVSLSDTIAYITDHGEVRAISIVDPSNPIEVGSYPTPGTPFGIVIAESRAYVADFMEGFDVISISDPSNLEEVGYYKIAGGAEAVAYSDPYAYLGTNDEGLMIFEYFDPTSIGNEMEENNPFPISYSLFQNYPNPFNPSTTIAYKIPGTESVSVQLWVYDLRGRLVKTLVNERKKPSSYFIHWDGRDEHGKELGSGVYLYRIIAGNYSSTKKMVIIR